MTEENIVSHAVVNKMIATYENIIHEDVLEQYI
jgi:hypothetical protein